MDIDGRKAMEQELRDADRRKTEFLAVLSHELRNPLAPIRNGIWLLEHAAPESEQAARSRDVIRRQTDHLARLVDDLLDVTRISRGKIALQRARRSPRDRPEVHGRPPLAVRAGGRRAARRPRPRPGVGRRGRDADRAGASSWRTTSTRRRPSPTSSP
jgi:hypothetical protein